MTDLIKQVGGIEAAREILSKAPSDCDAYETETHVIELDDLRQAIADYDLSNNHQKVSNCNESENIVKNGKSGNFIKIETDYVTDITNHISPSTVRIDK